MRFTVEAWDPDYGTSSRPDLVDSTAEVEVGVELPAARWRPLPPATDPAPEVLFVDGVRRVDANLWIEVEGRHPALGVAATYAAGAARCAETATVVAAEVRRGLFTGVDADPVETGFGRYEVMTTKGSTPEEMWLGIQERMGDLEGEIANAHQGDSLVVVDGPLSHRRHVAGAVGYVKTQHVQYLPDELAGTVADLPAGSRTPVFLIAGSWTRFSWYLRLATGAGPASGLVRCEVKADSGVTEAARIAGVVTATLPRYASEGHKDTRAPQNLYPIGGLERELRRRLGDRELALRSLRAASYSTP